MKTTIQWFLLLALPLAAAAQPLLDRPSLVSTEWLAENMDDPGLRIVDARPSMGPYLQAHLPGAVYLNTETVRASAGGVPARLLPPEFLGELFGKLGISNDHTVVIYSGADDSFSHATYIAFILEWLGHESIGVLDGGFEKWRTEGRAVTDGFPSYSQAEFVPRLNSAIMKTAEEVGEGRKAGALLLDARPSRAVAGGRLPGAESFSLEDTLTEGEPKRWKRGEEILEMVRAAGYDGQGTVVTYCTSGRQASQIWFTLRHVAGIGAVANYHGSLIDWTARGYPLESFPVR